MRLLPEHLTLKIDQPPFGLSREDFAALVARTVGMAADAVALPDGALAHVVVADESRFGTTIHQLQAAAGGRVGYTDNETYRAIAKAISPRGAGAAGAAGTVVLRDFVAALAVAFAAQWGPGEEWAADAPLFYYVLAHELGHCKDDYIHGAAADVRVQVDGGSIIRPVARAYEQTVLSEFAACVHAAPAMAAAVYAAHLDDWAAEAEDVLRAVGPAWAAYQADPATPDRLHTLALDAAHAVWVLCVQYAKIAGTAVGDPRLPPPTAPPGATGPAGAADAPGARAALERLDATLRVLWASYPDWPPGCGDLLLPAWQALARAHGFTFVEGEGGEALYLRRPNARVDV